MPGELARAFMLGGQLGRAHQFVAGCYDRFQEKWAGLHACADAARRDQLRGLQLVVEVIRCSFGWPCSICESAGALQRVMLLLLVFVFWYSCFVLSAREGRFAVWAVWAPQDEGKPLKLFP